MYSLTVLTCYPIRDHRRLYIGDTRGRVFSWSVTDSPG